MLSKLRTKHLHHTDLFITGVDPGVGPGGGTGPSLNLAGPWSAPVVYNKYNFTDFFIFYAFFDYNCNQIKK